MKELQKRLDALEAHLTLKNYSKATRSAYGCALKQFLRWRISQGIDGEFTQAHARTYLLFRYKQGLKWQTINGDYSSLLKFYREVLKMEWDVQHIPRPRREKTLPKILSKVQVKKLIDSGTNYKHQTFMCLLYGTGLRLNEALSLQLSDIDGQRLQIRVQKGKGAKDRYIDLPPTLLVLLRDYYRVYRPVRLLFNGRVPGQPWAERTAQWAIKNACKRAGIKREVSPHTFRHCYATHHLESGTSLVYLKQQLGHKHLKTTAQYIHLCRTIQLQIHHPIAELRFNFRISKV